ncbi:hypothetical protein BH11MYX3_BH11MYX3_16870 [soil metagenome]
MILVLVLAACGHKKTPKPENPNTPELWETESGIYFTKLAEVMEGSGGDCAKLVEGLKGIEEQSTHLAGVLVESGHQLKDHPVDAHTRERISKHRTLFDRCEAEKTDGFGDAVNATLFTVEPLKDDNRESAYRRFFTPE